MAYLNHTLLSDIGKFGKFWGNDHKPALTGIPSYLSDNLIQAFFKNVLKFFFFN
jgi:hypothetical protein